MKLYDVIIVGGSISGLSAAMTLGRSLRNVLVVDSGKPCNRYTPHSHNFITHDGSSPAQILETAINQTSKYKTVEFYNGEVSNVVKSGEIFNVEIDSGKELFQSRKIIFATGLKDNLPEIEGLKDCWGISAIHCPYCHGYEFRNKKTGILATGEQAFHYTQLARNLTSDVTLFIKSSELSAEQVNYIHTKGIKIIESEIQKLEHENGYLKSVLVNDEKIPFDAIYVKPDSRQSCPIPEKLGCEISESGLIAVNLLQKTNIPGILACGDNSCPFRALSSAASTGNMAGASANMELCLES